MQRHQLAIRDILRDSVLTMEVTGDSMAPCIRRGDKVRIRRARWYLPGDVVAYVDAHNQTVLHRLLGFRLSLRPASALVVTKGDNTNARDSPFPAQRILGRVDPISWRCRIRGALTAAALLVPAVARRMRRHRSIEA